MQPTWTPWMVVEPMIEGSLIGTEADIHAKIVALERDLNPRSLILKPLSTQFEKRREHLRIFGKAIKSVMAA